MQKRDQGNWYLYRTEKKKKQKKRNKNQNLQAGKCNFVIILDGAHPSKAPLNLALDYLVEEVHAAAVDVLQAVKLYGVEGSVGAVLFRLRGAQSDWVG
jgi:hypothetical protein